MLIRPLLTTFTAAAALAGCVSIPALQGRPEDVADRIGANAVAYNQAYGRAVADQVVLNALRARDRLPLFYLSMSGINDTSYVEAETSASIGSIGLGEGHPNWGVGSIGGTRVNRTIPAFSLNPIGPGNTGRALQFRPLSFQVFDHYWSRGWPRDVLLFTLVDSVSKSESGQAARTLPNAATSIDEYSALVAEIADAQGATLTSVCDPHEETASGCDARVTVGDVTYTLTLRSLDDVLYYLGSTLRTPGAGPRVRPPGVYPANPRDPAQWRAMQRTASLFQVARQPRERGRHFASVVQYQDEHYVAGEANGAQCILGPNNDCGAQLPGDATSTVLSLLTQLVILSQSEAAQLAPQATVVAR